MSKVNTKMSLYVAFIAIFITTINCFNYPPAKFYRSSPSSLLHNNHYQLIKLYLSQSSSSLQIPSEIESIKNEIQRYMEIRKSKNATMLPPESVEVAPTKGPIRKPENPFAFIQPSGRRISGYI